MDIQEYLIQTLVICPLFQMCMRLVKLILNTWLI